MGRTPALLYTLGLLLFELAFARFPSCAECCKRAVVWTSAQPYFLPCTHQQAGYYIGSYTPQVCEVANK
jgi:hypothetical protein